MNCGVLRQQSADVEAEAIRLSFDRSKPWTHQHLLYRRCANV